MQKDIEYRPHDCILPGDACGSFFLWSILENFSDEFVTYGDLMSVIPSIRDTITLGELNRKMAWKADGAQQFLNILQDAQLFRFVIDKSMFLLLRQYVFNAHLVKS